MKTYALIRVLAAATAAIFFTSCEGGGGGDSTGAPPNGITNVVLCIGDSITQGASPPAGAPYPKRLAGLCGKTVINAGQGGEKSSSTAARAPGLLAKHNPGYLCLLIGANDATAAFSPDHVAENVRKIIQAGKAQGAIVLVGTVTPAYEPHGFSEDNVIPINVAIRSVAREEGARLVDLEAEFGTDRSLIQDDGLHPSDAGTQLIAAAFNDKL